MVKPDILHPQHVHSNSSSLTASGAEVVLPLSLTRQYHSILLCIFLINQDAIQYVWRADHARPNGYKWSKGAWRRADASVVNQAISAEELLVDADHDGTYDHPVPRIFSRRSRTTALFQVGAIIFMPLCGASSVPGIFRSRFIRISCQRHSPIKCSPKFAFHAPNHCQPAVNRHFSTSSPVLHHLHGIWTRGSWAKKEGADGGFPTWWSCWITLGSYIRW